MISENYGSNSLSKTLGARIFKFELYRREKSEIQFQKTHSDSIHFDLITAESTNIKPNNQHYMSDSRLLLKIMSWEFHDLRPSTISTTAQVGTFSTTKFLAQNK